MVKTLAVFMQSIRIGVLSILLVSAAACGSSSSPAPAPTPAPTPAPAPAPAPASTPTPGAPLAVLIPKGAERLTTTAFNPDVADVSVGTTVTWTNTDSVSHTSTSDRAGWNSGIVAPGQAFSFQFQTAGTFSYHCAIHPGMVGSVVVR